MFQPNPTPITEEIPDPQTTGLPVSLGQPIPPGLVQETGLPLDGMPMAPSSTFSPPPGPTPKTQPEQPLDLAPLVQETSDGEIPARLPNLEAMMLKQWEAADPELYRQLSQPELDEMAQERAQTVARLREDLILTSGLSFYEAMDQLRPIWAWPDASQSEQDEIEAEANPAMPELDELPSSLLQ